MEAQGFLFLFLALILVITGLVFAILKTRQRAKAMQEWGKKYGMQYTPKDRSLDDEFPEFSCLQRGHSRYALNLLTGIDRGMRICAFDYHYSTGNGKEEHTHVFSSVMVNTGLPLKPLLIRTENFWDKITEFIGFDDIDFESAEFNREFYVKSPDKRWAYDVLHPKSMEYLLQAPRFILEFQGPYIMAYRDRRFAIADFEEAYQVIRDVLNLLPDYLKREWKGQ